MSTTLPLASIIIDNYNYGRFLKDAIDSALAQTYRNTEVIVVDDGSTDNSREIIAGYADRIIPVLKENGGQASALNAGYILSRGQVIFFLDSDDTLLPTSLEKTVQFFHDPAVVKVHWPLWVVDQHGRKTGEVVPRQTLPEGDLREQIIEAGPSSCTSSPTSGNAWARGFLDSIFPIPEKMDYYSVCADEYVYTLAPIFGVIKRILQPQGFYRLHGQNIYSGRTFDEKLRLELRGYEQTSHVLRGFLCAMGVTIDPEVWKRNSWWHRLHLATREIAALIPAGDAFLLVDDDTWGLDADAGRRPIPFLEKDGHYWGPPPDDATAILELERLRRSGASFVVFGWPAFWWLEHYSSFQEYMRSKYRSVLENDRLVVFDLREPIRE